MSLPDVTSREQWRQARRRLLVQEKELTRRHDALNASRRRLPMGHPAAVRGSPDPARDNDLNTLAGFANYPGLVSLHTPARHS